MMEQPRALRYMVQRWIPGKYVIVPDGHAPLPALFECREVAQDIAAKLASPDSPSSDHLDDRAG
jgi:hypothetical protein